MISGSKMLMIVAGLGGGTATGGIAAILSEATRLHIPTVVLATLPFMHEGNQRSRIAAQALDDEISGVADAVIALPNDLLFSSVLPPTVPLEEAFKTADAQISRTALALSELLCAGNLLNADFASFASLLKRRKSRCSVGVGVTRTGDGGVRHPELAFEDMLSSPLLGGSSRLQEADAVIFSLLGGPELSIGDVQTIFGLGSRFISKEAVLLSAASTAPEWKDMLQFTALAIKFDKEELAVNAKNPLPGRQEETESLFRSTPVEQPVLPFDPVSNGIMESTRKVVWNGEDLDIPTYIRRNIVIDSGKRVKR